MKLYFVMGLCLIELLFSSQAHALRPFSMKRKKPLVAQTVVLTSGTSWTVPGGVTTLTSVEVWGAGGGSAGWFGDGYGAGGGGAYAKKNNLTVTPGANITYSIGTGGASVANTNGGNGGDTWFVNSTTVLAKGGTGAVRDTTNYLGGAGGTSAASIGDTKYAGGNGGNSKQDLSGAGGGSAATPTGAGVNGGNNTSTMGGAGATAPGGGTGGTAGTKSATAPTVGGAGGDNQNGGGGGGGGGGFTGGSGGGAAGGRGGIPGGGAGSQGGNWNGVGIASGSGGGGQIILKFMQ